ncbi:MAG: Asp-tRNA(Asn)/Glu-tRNA(Gln) amidotransferase subunit GatC [Planctomycetota bacterium]
MSEHPDHDPRTARGLEHVARLARLDLAPDEREALQGHMARVLEWVEALGAIDTAGVDPSLHDELWASAALRPDAVEDSLPRADALRNAPAEDGLGFVVPRVVSE